MKTPEEIAEEYAFKFYLNEDSGYAMTMNRDAFLAGYKAAENHFRDVTEKVGPQWISVKDRLPAEDVWVLGYYRIYENDRYDVGVVKRFVHTWAEANIWLTNHKNGPLTYEEANIWLTNHKNGPLRYEEVDLITYWQPLPIPPKEEK